MLYALIARHVEATAARARKWILENWEQMLPKFVKVFPHEYTARARQSKTARRA